MLCGTSDVLYSRKTVADYLANAAFFLSNDSYDRLLTMACRYRMLVGSD